MTTLWSRWPLSFWATMLRSAGSALPCILSTLAARAATLTAPLVAVSEPAMVIVADVVLLALNVAPEPVAASEVRR